MHCWKSQYNIKSDLISEPLSFRRSRKIQIRNIPPHLQWEVSPAASRQHTSLISKQTQNTTWRIAVYLWLTHPVQSHPVNWNSAAEREWWQAVNPILSHMKSERGTGDCKPHECRKACSYVEYCSCYGAQVVFRLGVNVWDRDEILVISSDPSWAKK